MATPFQNHGAQPAKQSHYAPIWVDRMFTGLWTNRSPLRDAATPYAYDKFYSASRYDSLITGLNTEVTDRLTLQRRPGHSVYNSATFNPVNCFTSFRTSSGGTETIQVIVDEAAAVYDGTGPSTRTLIFTKSGGAGQSYFQPVGNTLYFGNGTDQKRYTAAAGAFNWGVATPTSAPTLAQGTGAAFWCVSTAYAQYKPLLDTNGNIQIATTAGTTGTAYPVWATAVGGQTTDGTVTWTNCGPPARWGPYNATATTTTTTGPPIARPGNGRTIRLATVDDGNGGSSVVIDNGGGNGGGSTGGGTGTTATTVAGTRKVGDIALDANGNIQYCTVAGSSGVTEPTWSSTFAVTTADGTATWVMAGSGKVAAFIGYTYDFGWQTTSLHVGTCSPVSVTTGPILGTLAVTVTGAQSTDAQVTFAYIFRTLDGGATRFKNSNSTNASGAGNWTYTDTVADAALNQLIAAPENHQNDAPPTGLINLAYHLNRVWGSVGNTVYCSQTNNLEVGVFSECFPPANAFPMPSQVIRLWPTVQGLLVFTASDVYIIVGTTLLSLYVAPFARGIGLANYNAFDINGSIAYMVTADKQCVAFDPNAGGIGQVGFPIADKIEGFTPASVYVAWYTQGSDQGLYVANGTDSWYRLSPTSAPEAGQNWSPIATLAAGMKAVQAVETAAGTRSLLLGPKAATTGPILKRDTTVFTDNSATYAASARVGSLVLAHPGQVAAVGFITTQCPLVGSRIVTKVLLNEISGTPTALTSPQNDPPFLAASATLDSQRWYLSTLLTPAWCLNLQIDFSWPAEAFGNELYAYAIWGAVYQENAG